MINFTSLNFIHFIYLSIGLCLVCLMFLVPVIAIPMMIAGIICYIFSPIFEYLEKYLTRGVISIIIVILSYVLLFALSFVIIPLLFREIIIQLEEVIYWIYSSKDAIVEAINKYSFTTITFDMEFISSMITNHFEDISKITFSQLSKLLVITDIITISLISPIFTGYIVYYRDLIRNNVKDLLHPQSYKLLSNFLSECDGICKNYFLGQFYYISCLFLLFLIGFLTIGTSKSFFYSLLVALSHVVPYLGALISIIFVLVVEYIEVSNISSLYWILGVFILIQIFDFMYLSPKIFGSKMDMNPFLIILALLFFGSVFGIVGAVIAIPLTAILRNLMYKGLYYLKRDA